MLEVGVCDVPDSTDLFVSYCWYFEEMFTQTSRGNISRRLTYSWLSLNHPRPPLLPPVRVRKTAGPFQRLCL